MSSQNPDSPSTLSKEKKDWISLLNESVHTSDDVDIGDVYGISRNFIIVKRGFINIHYYYIPLQYIDGWDGIVLWLKIPESNVTDKYERDKIPDPNQYYINDYPYYDGFADFTYPLPVILPKYTHHSEQIKKSLPEKKVPKFYSCALCEAVFDTESGLDAHMGGSGH